MNEQKSETDLPESFGGLEPSETLTDHPSSSWIIIRCRHQLADGTTQFGGDKVRDSGAAFDRSVRYLAAQLKFPSEFKFQLTLESISRKKFNRKGDAIE